MSLIDIIANIRGSRPRFSNIADGIEELSSAVSSRRIFSGVTGGSGNAYTLTTGSSITLQNGDFFELILNHSASGSSTFQVDGNSAKPIVTINDRSIFDNMLFSGKPISLIYYNGDFIATSIQSGQQSYSPTIGSSGGTLSSTSVTFARFEVVNTRCKVEGDISGTASSTPNYITVTLPVENSTSDSYAASGSVDPSDASFTASGMLVIEASEQIRLYPHDGATFANGGWRGLFSLEYNVG